jgi:hypothetical protein
MPPSRVGWRASEGRGAYLTSTCTATKRDGSPCTLPSYGSDGLCWAHDPKNAERRKELLSIKQRLSDLADDVLEGNVDKGVAAVASQILNVYLRAVSTELAVREQLELLERLEALEGAAEQQKGGKRWGA